MAYLQVSPLGGSRDETWRGQGIRTRSVSWNLPKLPNLTSAASPRVDISSTCKVGQKLGVSFPLLTCSLSASPSRVLYCRGWKSWRDLWITLYNKMVGNDEKFLFLYILMLNYLLVRSAVTVGCTITLWRPSMNTLIWTVKCDYLKLCYWV